MQQYMSLKYEPSSEPPHAQITSRPRRAHALTSPPPPFCFFEVREKTHALSFLRNGVRSFLFRKKEKACAYFLRNPVGTPAFSFLII